MPKIVITHAMVSFSHRTVLAPSALGSQKAAVVECTCADACSCMRSTSKQLTCRGVECSVLVKRHSHVYTTALARVFIVLLVTFTFSRRVFEGAGLTGVEFQLKSAPAEVAYQQKVLHPCDFEDRARVCK